MVHAHHRQLDRGRDGARPAHQQILFPKIILPVTESLAQIVSFLFGMLVLGVVLVVAYQIASPEHPVVPVIAVVQFTFVVGVTFMVSLR